VVRAARILIQSPAIRGLQKTRWRFSLDYRSVSQRLFLMAMFYLAQDVALLCNIQAAVSLLERTPVDVVCASVFGHKSQPADR
jgi:hypothetical protein